MSFFRIAATGLVALLLTATAPAFALLSYHIQIDTSTLLGTTGFLDFQFNPGSAPAPAATAVVFNVSGATFADPASDPPIVDGDVSGALPTPGTLTFGNSTSFNAYLAPVTFGALFQFTLNLDGETGNNGPNTAFSLAALDGNFNPQLPADPGGYALLTLDRDPASGRVAYLNPNPSVVTITTVPEPSALALLVAGMGLLTLTTLAGRRPR